VDYWGSGFMDSVNRRDLAAVVRALPGRAEGGPVGMSPAHMVAPSLALATSAPSLAGLELTGTLDTPWGPASVRGIVREELATVARSSSGMPTTRGRSQ